MNLAKKSKVIAAVLVAVTIIALVATICVFAIPRSYKGGENAATTLAYGMSSVSYNTSNASVAFVDLKSGSDAADLRVLFPNAIYLDKTETLQDVGYFIAYDAWALSSNGQNDRLIVMDNVLGYYASIHECNVDTSSNSYTMHNLFSGYNFKYTSPSSTVFYENTKHESGTRNMGIVIEGRGVNTYVKNALQGSYNTGIASDLINNRDSQNDNLPGIKRRFSSQTGVTVAYTRWRGNQLWNNSWENYLTNATKFDSTGSGEFHGLSGFTNPTYKSNVEFDIYIYDKSQLNTAINKFKQDLENDNASFLSKIDGGNGAYNRAKTFINNIENNVLTKREVTQTNINDAVTSINNYKYQLTPPTEAKLEKEYDANAVSINSIFSRYDSTYFNLRIVKGSSDVNEVKDAGTYDIYVSPKNGATREIVWYNQNVSDGNGFQDFKKCANYVVKERKLENVILTNPIRNLKYKVSDHEIALGAISSYGTLAGGIAENPITAQLSLNQGTYEDGVDKVNLSAVGKHTVYFKLTAPNHTAFEGSIEVNIDKADIVLYTKTGGASQLYGDAIPGSDKIAEILDYSNISIFDAVTDEEKKDYIIGNASKGIEGIISNFAIVDGGKPIENVGNKFPDAKKYNIQITRNSNYDDRVATVTFHNNCNVEIYTIQPRPVKVKWIPKTNMWYDGQGGKRPTAVLADGEEDNFVGDTSTSLSEVTIVGLGQNDEGYEVELIGGEAISAGAYTATVSCTNSNYTVDTTTLTSTFKILRRVINVDIKDRARTYAQSTTAQGVWDNYIGNLFPANQGESIYSVALDASINDGKPAIVDQVTDVFTIALDDAQYTEGTKNERYYKVGVYTLSPKLAEQSGAKSRNYELGANCKSGSFTVSKAEINFTVQDIPSQVFKGTPLDMVFDKLDSRIGLKGWEYSHREEVKMYFADTEAGAEVSTQETYLQKTDAGVYDIWYRITAPNHFDEVGHLTGEITASTVYVDVTGQKNEFIYGTAVPNSADLMDMLGIEYYWSTDAQLNEQLKVENMGSRVEFYLLNGTGGEGHFNAGDRIEAGKYTVSHSLVSGEKASNYVFTYVTDDNGVHKNVNAFAVSKKTLHADWTQSGAGWNGLKYTFSGQTPIVEVKPVASEIAFTDNIQLSVNVVGGGSLGTTVGSYKVYTALTKTENIKNYTLLDSEMTFEIVPLQISINVKSIEREFGTAQKNSPIGKNISLLDPTNPNAQWSYAAGSARFISDDYSNFCFISDAITPDGSYKDVNLDGYPITIATVEGASGEITKNYDVIIANPDDAVFKITPVDIHYMGRQFNIDFDKEPRMVTRAQIASRISVSDLNGISIDDFVVNMTNLKTDNTPSTAWIDESAEATGEATALGKYYISILIQHKNFNDFNAEIEVNIRSKWISVTIDGTVLAEYGDKTHSSDELYDALKDKMSIMGLVDPSAGDEDTYLQGEAAWSALKGMIGLFVGKGDTTSKLENNDLVGKYSIFFDEENYDAVTHGEKYFRFLANGGSQHTSNIDAYVVGPRTLEIDWQNMNEEYGNHSDSSPSHTYKEHLILAAIDSGKDIRTTERYEIKNADGQWETVNGHAKNVGIYRVVVTGVNNSNYKVPDDLWSEFEITPRQVTIDLADRNDLVYGSPRATKDRISEYLNETAQGAGLYTVVGDKVFVDDVAGIFKYAIGEYTLGEGLVYLTTGEYDVDIEMIKDSVIANNYTVVVSKKGKFNVTNATITYDRAQFVPKTFNGSEIQVMPAGDYYTLQGDGDKLKDSVVMGFKINGSAEDFTADLTVTEAGEYGIDIRITAPNHDVFITTDPVKFTVSAVNVEINMHQATKTYGDTLDELLTEAGVADFNEWLIKKCGITFDTYVVVDGQKQHVEVNADRLKEDFLFKVIQNEQGNGTPIVVGKNRVGSYTVYHEIEGAYAAKMKNYSVNYYRDPSKPDEDKSRCNYDAYYITKRNVAVVWYTTGAVESNNVFKYNGGVAPAIDAKVQQVGVDGMTSVPVFSTFIEDESDREKAAIEFNVGRYKATVVGDDSFNINAFLENYNMTNTEFGYTIVPKEVEVAINNKTRVYGSDDTKVGAHIDNNGAFTVTGVDIAAISHFIELYIDGVADKEFYGVDTYALKGKCTSKNYDVTFTDGIFEVTPAIISISSDRYDAKYNGKDLVVDVKEIFKQNGSAAVFGDMDWDDAQVLYKQADGSYSATKPIIKGVTPSNGVMIDCKAKLDNHSDVEFAVTFYVAKADLIVNLESGEASSIYGDALLGSDDLFAKTSPSLDESSSITGLDLKALIQLRVDVSGKATAGTYNLAYSFVNAEDAELYNIELNNAHVYEVTKREITIEWNYTEPFEYDQQLHTVSASVVGALNGDSIAIEYSGNIANQAGKYTATVYNIDNGNYKLGETGSLVWYIAPKGINVEWTAGDFTYDGNGHIVGTPVVVEGLLGLDTTEITVSGEQINAGKHIATAVAVNGNYYVINDEFEFEIKKASINVTWISETLTYNGTAQAPKAEVDASGLIGGDTCEVIVEGAQVNAGSHVATATLSNGNYYVANNVENTYTIAPKTISFTWSDDKLTYNGEAQAPKAVAVGAVNGDEVEFVIEGMNVDAGNGYVAKVVGVKDNGNYAVDEAAKQITKDYSIAKGVNSFIGNVTLPSVVDKMPWTGEDKPEATWGEVVVKYYSDKDCTKEVVDIAKAGEGKYWIKITVAGTKNYDEISQVFEIELQGGLNVIPVVVGAIATLALLAGALAVVMTTNKKKKQQGGAV